MARTVELHPAGPCDYAWQYPGSFDERVCPTCEANSFKHNAVNRRRDSRTLKKAAALRKEIRNPYCAIAMADYLAAASETCRNILAAT
jgi:hypothetical protein